MEDGGGACPPSCWSPEVGQVWISRRAVRRFNRQLAMLIEGGVALQVAVDLLRLQYRSRAWQALLQEVSRRLRQGDPLSQALACYRRLFPRSTIETLQWAEKTGSAD